MIAPVSSAKQTIDTIKQTVNVQALDAKGQVLSIENPAPQVKVTVGLTAPTKDVPLNVSMTGTPPLGSLITIIVYQRTKLGSVVRNQF